jgi:hypothetical protein
MEKKINLNEIKFKSLCLADLKLKKVKEFQGYFNSLIKEGGDDFVQ